MKMFRTMSVLGVLAVAQVAGAATTTHYLRVTVPFSFMLAGQRFNPGEYRVQESENGVVMVQGEGKAAAAISTPGNSARAGQSTSLQFVTNSDTRYLIGLAVEGGGTRSIPVPAAERQVSLTH